MKLLGGLVEVTGEDFAGLIRTAKEAACRLRVPKNRKRTIGIVIALRTEDIKEEKRLKSDFISELQNDLNESLRQERFTVITFPRKLCERITDQIVANEYLTRSRAHMMIFGYLHKRKIQGCENYVFKLHGIVKHRPVPISTSNKFSLEFRELLPEKINFPENDELLGFEFAQDSAAYVIKYIIGIAASLSMNPPMALELFDKLQDEICQDSISQITSLIEKLRKRLPQRIEKMLEVIICAYSTMYAQSRERGYIRACEPFLLRIGDVAPDNYVAHLARAILYYFDGKLDDAIKEYEKASCSIDVAWRYGLGFLYAFKGDVQAAWDQYKRAFRGNTSQNVLNDVEIFITEVIEEHPKKVQLIYFRALLNYKAKEDYTLAINDFEQFLERAEPSNFLQLQVQSRKYLSELRRLAEFA